MSVNEDARQVLCPGCGQMVELSPSAQEGDRISCDICAGSAFRVVHREGQWAMEPIPTASCPVCYEVIELDSGVQPGDIVEHCDRAFRLSFEYGAWALEV